MLLDATPEINSDFKKSFILYPPEVFLVKEKNGIYVSVFARQGTTIVGVGSWRLSLVYRGNVG